MRNRAPAVLLKEESNVKFGVSTVPNDQNHMVEFSPDPPTVSYKCLGGQNFGWVGVSELVRHTNSKPRGISYLRKVQVVGSQAVRV